MQVQDAFPTEKNPPKIAKKYLEKLSTANGLKPAVWAQRTKKAERHSDRGCAVSLGVRCFVRPLFLYTKLRLLENGEPNRLNTVEAFAIKHKYEGNNNESLKHIQNTLKLPCVSCQHRFGFTPFPIIGNCAEYDIIGNVHPDLLQSDKWNELQSACKQHLNAFNAMMQSMRNDMQPEEIMNLLRKYFASTRDPITPKVLKYQWKSAMNGGFKLIAMDWPPTD